MQIVSGYGPVADSSEHGDELSVFIKGGEVLDQMIDYHL
jgi:hypothetical protein